MQQLKPNQHRLKSHPELLSKDRLIQKMAGKKYNRIFEDFKIVDNILVGDQQQSENEHKQLGEKILGIWDKYPDHVSQIEIATGKQTKNAEMKFSSIRLAIWLRKQGLGKNDVVSLCTHNHVDAYIPIVATIFVGAIYNPWHYELTLKTACHFMKLIQPKIMFACESILEVLMEAAKTEKVNTKFVVFGTYRNLPSVRGIIDQQSHEDVFNFQLAKIENPWQDLGMIFFSSGTTGMPKGVMHTYQSVLMHVESFLMAPKKIGGRNLWYSSLYWITGTLCTLQTIFSNSTRIIHEDFDPIETCKVVEKYKVTWCLTPPTQIVMIEKSDALKKYKLKSLLQLNCGGAKINKEIFESFTKKLSHVKVIMGYGSTEVGGVSTIQTENRKALNSIGTVVPNVQIKIIGVENGQALGPNQEGELCQKMPHYMLGYYKNPQATAEAMDKDGWLHSGDKAFYNEDGEVFIIDRLKEVMKFRGHHVSPTEIEELLLTHPGVLEVAVVGVPNLIDGDHPMAFVKKASNVDVTEDELVKLSSELGHLKKLQKGVKFLQEMPRTASGKISRGELKAMAKAYE